MSASELKSTRVLCGKCGEDMRKEFEHKTGWQDGRKFTLEFYECPKCECRIQIQETADKK